MTNVVLSSLSYHRIVPIRFRRGPGGPALDDRHGHKHPATVSYLAGSGFFVTLERCAISPDAPLFLESAHDKVNIGFSPRGPFHAKGTAMALPKGKSHVCWVSTHKHNGPPKKGFVLVRANAKNGPVIGKLEIWVLERLQLGVMIHQVFTGRIVNRKPKIDASRFDVAVFRNKTFWYELRRRFAQAGIVLNARRGPFMRLATALEGIVTLDNGAKISEPGHFLRQYRGDVGRLHVWLLPAILWRLNKESCPFVGFGMSPSRARIPHQGMVLLGYHHIERLKGGGRKIGRSWLAREKIAAGKATGEWWASMLAHEIGHYLKLSHPGRKDPDDHEDDVNARQMVMYAASVTALTDKGKPAYGDEPALRKRGGSELFSCRGLPWYALNGRVGPADIPIMRAALKSYLKP